METIAANGATFTVASAGDGDPPFVFIHGLACDHTAWQAQFDDLSRDHRCINVDLRGRGGSPATPPYHTTQQADDVAAIMRALNIGPAIIVGHSLGGITALLLNERHPELVLAIVAGDSPIRQKGLGAAGMVDALKAAGDLSLIQPLVESFWNEETTEDVKTYVRDMMLSCPPGVAAGMIEDAPDERMTALVKLADQKPFMAIWGEKALGEPSWLREVAVFIRQEPVAGTGHFFQVEKPAVTNALLRAFLDDVARDPRLQR
jgi:pimeloyl-ACP methyl ester carboxylesterase